MTVLKESAFKQIVGSIILGLSLMQRFGLASQAL